MNKKLLTLILAGAGVVLILFSVILLGSSASLVGDVEDLLNGAIGEQMSGSYGYSDFSSFMGSSFNLDIDIDAGVLREAKAVVNDIIDEIPGMDLSVKDVLSQLGIKSAGFKLFALTMRGWFFWVGIICIAAAVVVMALNANAKLASMIIDTAKAFGAAVVSGVRGLFSGIKTSMPKRTPRVMYGCPNCGAPFAPGTTFCGSCGTRLPDPSTIGVCKHCGTRNEPGARFCSGCGQPM